MMFVGGVGAGGCVVIGGAGAGAGACVVIGGAGDVAAGGGCVVTGTAGDVGCTGGDVGCTGVGAGCAGVGAGAGPDPVGQSFHPFFVSEPSECHVISCVGTIGGGLVFPS